MIGFITCFSSCLSTSGGGGVWVRVIKILTERRGGVYITNTLNIYLYCYSRVQLTGYSVHVCLNGGQQNFLSSAGLDLDELSPACESVRRQDVFDS